MNYIRESFYRKVAEKRFGLDEGFWDTAKEYGQTALSVGGSFLKRNVGKVLGGAGAALGGVLDYNDRRNQGHSRLNALGGAASTAVGGGLGALAGGAVGTAALPGAGTAVGAVAGGIGGAQGAATLYDLAVGNTRDEEPKLPPGSNASTAPKKPAEPAPSMPSMSDTGDVEPATTQQPSVKPAPAPSTVSTADTGGADPREGGKDSGRNDTEYDRQKQSALASAKDTASAFGPSATPAAQQAPKPAPQAGDETGGFGYDKPIDRSKPAAQQQAAPPSVRPRPAPSPVSTADTGGDKYGSGNASAGFERGKYAAPDASDNSSGANELRSKQQAVDRGTSNLGESKSKYMNESITFERFLRKNKYGKNF